MTPEAVKQTIVASAPSAKNLTAAVEVYASATGASVPTLWRYIREGLPERAPKMMQTRLLADAKKHSIEPSVQTVN